MFGAVASVNGSTDPTACGSGDTGTFTVTDRDGNTFTVNVDSTTKFVGHHDDNTNGASFADVCVGQKIGAKGDVTDTTVAADMVIVRAEKTGDHEGDHEGDDQDSDAQEHEIEHPDSVTSPDDSTSGGQHDGSSNDGHDDGSGDQVSGHD